MSRRDRITVVVVTWQGAHLLPACLESLRQQFEPHEVVVVDNASTDGTAEYLRAHHPTARVVRLTTNTGFAGGADAGLAAVRTPYAALLNNDAVAKPSWLGALADALDAHPGAAAVTSRMLLADRRPAVVNNAGVVLRRDGYAADRGLGQPDGPGFAAPVEVFGFSGGAAALRMAAVRAVGGFCPRFFLYYEDTDLSWRLRLAGWSIRYEPSAVVSHEHSATVDQRSEAFAFYNERNRLLMLAGCAPAPAVVAQLARFAVTTAALLARRILGRTVPPAQNFRAPLRAKVVVSLLRLMPWALQRRAAIGRLAVVPRARIMTAWAE